MEYAETTVVQCGYRLTETKYVVSGEWESKIGDLLDYYEHGDPARRRYHNNVLDRFSFDRNTVMKQNFDIELSIVPE